MGGVQGPSPGKPRQVPRSIGQDRQRAHEGSSLPHLASRMLRARPALQSTRQAATAYGPSGQCPGVMPLSACKPVCGGPNIRDPRCTKGKAPRVLGTLKLIYEKQSLPEDHPQPTLSESCGSQWLRQAVLLRVNIASPKTPNQGSHLRGGNV